MNVKPLSEAKDEDARQVMAALQRAAVRARQLAKQTQTAVVVMRDGKIIVEQYNNNSSKS